MKNIFSVIIILFFLSACDKKTYTLSEVEQLQLEGQRLQKTITEKLKQLNSTTIAFNEANSKLTALSKENPKYVLEIEFSQSRVSLDVWQHVKDGMNAGKFKIPVDKQFFDSVSVGTRLVDNFRAGSFIMRGSFSSWNFKVTSKEIQ